MDGTVFGHARRAPGGIAGAPQDPVNVQQQAAGFMIVGTGNMVPVIRPHQGDLGGDPHLAAKLTDRADVGLPVGIDTELIIHAGADIPGNNRSAIGSLRQGHPGLDRPAVGHDQAHVGPQGHVTAAVEREGTRADR